MTIATPVVLLGHRLTVLYREREIQGARARRFRPVSMIPEISGGTHISDNHKSKPPGDVNESYRVLQLVEFDFTNACYPNLNFISKYS